MFAKSFFCMVSGIYKALSNYLQYPHPPNNCDIHSRIDPLSLQEKDILLNCRKPIRMIAQHRSPIKVQSILLRKLSCRFFIEVEE